MALSHDTSSKFIVLIRFLNIALAILQVVAGLHVLLHILHASLTHLLLSAYIIFSAFLLVFYEFQFQKSHREADANLRKYCGFLYDYRGLALFLIFISVIDWVIVHGFFGKLASYIAMFDALFILLVGYNSPKSIFGSAGGLPYYGAT